VNADLSALLHDRATALPFAEQSAGSEDSDVGKTAELLVGDIQFHSAWARVTGFMGKSKDSSGDSLLCGSGGQPDVAFAIGRQIRTCNAKCIFG